jgi:hypothetical protein
MVKLIRRGVVKGNDFSTNKQCHKNLTMKFINSFICRYFQYF